MPGVQAAPLCIRGPEVVKVLTNGFPKSPSQTFPPPRTLLQSLGSLKYSKRTWCKRWKQRGALTLRFQVEASSISRNVRPGGAAAGEAGGAAGSCGGGGSAGSAAAAPRTRLCSRWRVWVTGDKNLVNTERYFFRPYPLRNSPWRVTYLCLDIPPCISFAFSIPAPQGPAVPKPSRSSGGAVKGRKIPMFLFHQPGSACPLTFQDSGECILLTYTSHVLLQPPQILFSAWFIKFFCAEHIHSACRK